MVIEITTSIEFQMSLLLFVAFSGYLLASRINQSAVVGEILVGLVVGPSLLGLITHVEFVRGLAHISAVILLFVVGLEFKIRDIYDIKFALIALFGVAVPWAGGYVIAGFFGYGFQTAVIVGTALSATSIVITAGVLREAGMLKSPVARAIIGAAIIDDVLCLLALSLSIQLIVGELSITYILIVFLKAAGFLIVGSFLGHTLLTEYVLKIDRSEIAKKFPEYIFIFAMMIAFFYSIVAELLGLSAIVGAFIAGISLEGIKRMEHSRDYREGAEYLHIIFASIFFVSIGILADLRALQVDTLWFLIILVVFAILTKLVGCFIPAKIGGMTTKDSLTVGFGMVPRGEIAMVVAFIGLSQGILNQELYVSLVLMAFFTTLISPLALRKLLS